MQRILVMHPFGIGDVIFSFSLVHVLKKEGFEIDFLCNERTAGFVRHNPDIREVYEFNRDELRSLREKSFVAWIKEMRSWVGRFRAGGYSACIDLSMGREYAFMAMLGGIKKRVGFDYRNRGRFLTHKFPIDGFDGKPVRETVNSLISFFELPDVVRAGYPSLEKLEDEWMNTFRKESGMTQSYAVIAPGGGASWGKDAGYKQWDESGFSEIGRFLSDQNGFGIVVTGSEDEADMVSRVAREIPGSVALTDASLNRVFRLLQEAEVFVGNDGGLLHLADLADTKIVGLYGPVSEETYGPIQRSGNRTVSADVTCRPCYRKFRFPLCENDRICQSEIRAEEVKKAISEVLSA